MQESSEVRGETHGPVEATGEPSTRMARIQERRRSAKAVVVMSRHGISTALVLGDNIVKPLATQDQAAVRNFLGKNGVDDAAIDEILALVVEHPGEYYVVSSRQDEVWRHGVSDPEWFGRQEIA